MRFPKTQASRSARLEGWGGPWFETPRKRLRNPGRLKITAPHHEGREEPRVRQIDRNPLSAQFPKFVSNMIASDGRAVSHLCGSGPARAGGL